MSCTAQQAELEARRTAELQANERIIEKAQLELKNFLEHDSRVWLHYNIIKSAERDAMYVLTHH